MKKLKKKKKKNLVITIYNCAFRFAIVTSLNGGRFHFQLNEKNE